MTADRMWLRGLGTAVLALSLLFYQTGSASLWQSLLLPIIMAAAALALVQNLAAVAFGTLILASIHTDLSATSWVPSLAYPAIAGVAAVLLGGIILQRFRKTIAATREARWARRNSQTDSQLRD